MSWCNIFMLHQFCPKSLRQRGEDGSDSWSTGSSEGERSFASLWSRNDALPAAMHTHTMLQQDQNSWDAHQTDASMASSSEWNLTKLVIFFMAAAWICWESHIIKMFSAVHLMSANPQPLEVSSSPQNVKIRLISVKRPKRRELRSETAANPCPGPTGQKRRCSCGRQRRFLPISRVFF